MRLIFVFSSIFIISITNSIFAWNLWGDNEGNFLNSVIPKPNKLFPENSFVNYFADKAIELAIKVSIKVWKVYLEKWQPIEEDVRGSSHFWWYQIKGVLTYENITFMNPSDVELNDVKSDISKKSAVLQFFFSQFRLDDIHYTVRARIMNMLGVEGRGIVRGNFTDLYINSSVQYVFKDRRVYIKKLNMSYIFEDVKVQVTGLSVPKIFQDDLEKKINKGVAAYMRKHEHGISKTIAKKIKHKFNRRKDSTFMNDIEEVIQNFLVPSA